LSICNPARAAITCSIISTATPQRAIAVRRALGMVYETSAGMGGASSRSVRWKAMPCPGAAGRNRSETSAAVRKPTPETEAVRAIVLCDR
jgi:hypothetical protein